MNSNKAQSAQASNEAAQTASVGDDRMMTYMKMPLNGSENNANSSSPNGNSSESELNFLDGLFDRMSGSSDNGSDKGDNTDANTAEIGGNSNTAPITRNRLLLASTSASSPSQNQGQMDQSSPANMNANRAALSLNAAASAGNVNVGNMNSSLPMNPLQNQACHMTTTDTTSMHTVNAPQHQHHLNQLQQPQRIHSTTVQQHSQHLSTGAGNMAPPGVGVGDKGKILVLGGSGTYYVEISKLKLTFNFGLFHFHSLCWAGLAVFL